MRRANRTSGHFTKPEIVADLGIERFVLANIPFGDITQAHGTFNGQWVELTQVKATKGKSEYAMPTGRIDLKNVPEIAEKAINRQPGQRFPDVLSFADALRPNFPLIPAERRSFQINWRIMFIVLGALLVISLLVLFALSLVSQ